MGNRFPDILLRDKIRRAVAPDIISISTCCVESVDKDGIEYRREIQGIPDTIYQDCPCMYNFTNSASLEDISKVYIKAYMCERVTVHDCCFRGNA